jgi:glycosyltransferase involved in cell wall biosynthesis
VKILINTAAQRFGGAIQVALSFINECKNFPQHEYHVWVGQGVGKILKKEDFPSNFNFYDFDFGVLGFRAIAKLQKTLKPFEEKIKPDIMICTSGPTYYHSNVKQIVGFNLPNFIYTESPYVRDLKPYRKLRLALRKIIQTWYYRQDTLAFLVQTDDVNVRVKELFKTDKVHTVTNICSNFYFNIKEFPNRLPLKEKNEVRLLTLTSYYPHKNLELIPLVAEELTKRGFGFVRFVLTLKNEDFVANKLQHPMVINVGPLKPQECPSLYREIDIMFLPTLAECFSASYAEAMVMEKPIVTTNLGFATSVCAEAAIYFEPKNHIAAADAIINLLSNSTLKETLIAKGKIRLKEFDTPQIRAKKYLELCEYYAGQKNNK